MSEWKIKKTRFPSQAVFVSEFSKGAASRGVYDLRKISGTTTQQGQKLKTYYMFCPAGERAGSKHAAMNRCSFGARVLERLDGHWLLQQLDWEHDCGIVGQQPPPSKSINSASTKFRRKIDYLIPRESSSAGLVSEVMDTQPPPSRPAPPRIVKRPRILDDPDEDAEERQIVDSVKVEPPEFDSTTLFDFSNVMPPPPPPPARPAPAPTREPGAKAAHRSVSVEVPLRSIPKSAPSQPSPPPPPPPPPSTVKSTSEPASTTGRPTKRKSPICPPPQANEFQRRRKSGSPPRSASIDRDSTVASQSTLSDDVEHEAVESTAALGPPPPPSQDLTAFLNSLNTGLGTAVGQELMQCGITSPERLCGGLTCAQWREFVDEVLASRVSKFDAAILKAVVGRYIEGLAE